MNSAYDRVLSADTETRMGLFTTTAQRLNSTPQNIEKDFWVCWTLDALFNGLPTDSPRLLFKGGTSLSKGFGLISRFSEDIDVTVFRGDLGERASVAELQNLSRTKREAKLDAIKDACTVYIQGPIAAALTELVAAAAERTGLSLEDFQVRADDDDKQTLLLWYPTATPVETYVRPAVKIESGAKSALDPNTPQTIRPYVDEDAPGLDLSVPNVTTVDPERTFWDKVVILHGLRRWFERRGELRGDGQRISRHYYDIHRLMESETGRRAIANRDLGTDCVAHARMFFNRKDYDLASAEPPTFALLPHDEMVTPCGEIMLPWPR
ncbi:nucleotidyl transferase AbiEii/AbiGii toxin family protein [Mesorhizobium escarrei]|uniref:Nucleotidyl transferase AbiEii/AbiGii toxin family protein n=1 Tax=Mesorhizobium escarrei TaxID=666018 RepID=A0ABM9DZS3_9HYPH|nr:Nucleotidyl transferase AbiEii/AbiGii toxin family protein [Mesorhizobium escarrei]